MQRSAPRRILGHLPVAAWRRSALHGPRLALCLALAAAAIALGGSGGVLLGVMTLMVALESALPMPGSTWSEADDRFKRAARARAGQLRRGRLAPDRLEVLDDRGGWASVAERRALGVQAIAVDSITGTVEESKARIFDGRFRPDRSAGERWKRIWLAQARGASLPPISVYRLGAVHVVRDGHHRVSVARDLGAATIDADVVELRRP